MCIRDSLETGRQMEENSQDDLTASEINFMTFEIYSSSMEFRSYASNEDHHVAALSRRIYIRKIRNSSTNFEDLEN